MRKFIYFFLGTCLITSCSRNPSVVNFIPGVYVAYYENEFHKTHDTLQIERSASSKTVYEVSRRYYYTTIVDGRQLSPTYKTEHWAALLDEAHQVLTEQRHGSIISFDPVQNQLKRGNRVYHKIDR